MKRLKTFFMCFCLCGMLSSLAAQERGNAGAERRFGEMEAKQAERLADEFKLKGESRKSFLALYKNYRQDMNKHRFAEIQHSEKTEKKEAELTDEKASARIQEEFDRKAQAIVDAYNRLEVEKKYYEEFSKTLSPKQLMKIFAPVRQPRGMRNVQPRGARQGERMGGRNFGGGQGGFDDGDDW